MFLRGVGNMLDPVTRVRPVPSYGQIDFKTAGCVDDLSLDGHYADQRLRHAPATTRCSSAPRGASAAGFTGGFQYQFSRNKGTTQGSNEAATAQNTFDFELGVRHQPAGHPAHLQRLARLPAARRGLLDGRLARRRHRQRAQRRAAST